MSDLKAVLEKVGERASSQPDAFDRLTRLRTRRNRSRRIASAAVALCVAAGGGFGAYAAFGHGTTRPVMRPFGLKTYADPADWSISYPAPWHIERFESSGRIATRGVWISNHPLPSTYPVPPDGIPSPFLASFPPNGLVIQLPQALGGPLSIPEQPDSRFPISFSDLKPAPGPSPIGPVSGTFIANGNRYDVSVWMGPGVSDSARQAVKDVVSSWRFRRLTAGTEIQGLAAFWVLDPPSAFPPGSVTRFDDSNLPGPPNEKPLPFYLIHNASGFYALAWPNDLVGGYKNCDVTYDPGRNDFFCSNGARWNLDGSVEAKPEGRGPGFPDDPLAVLLVRFSLDGHVLVSPSVYMNNADVDLRLTGGGPLPSPSPSFYPAAAGCGPVPDRIVKAARENLDYMGAVRVRSIWYVETDGATILQLIGEHPGPTSKSRRGILLVMNGHFVFAYAHRAPGAAAPEGGVAIAVLDPTTLQGEIFGIRPKAIDLSKVPGANCIPTKDVGWAMHS